MSKNLDTKKSLLRIPALLLLVAAGLFAVWGLANDEGFYREVLPAGFLDTVEIPFHTQSFGDLKLPIYLDNYLIFQEFKALPGPFEIAESKAFGLLVFLVSVLALAGFSHFKKLPFLGAGLGWIVLLTLTNVNGLNIGAPSSNSSLIVMIIGSLVPTLIFHIWLDRVAFLVRSLVIGMSFGTSIGILIFLSPISDPALYLAEHSLVPALIFAIAWLFWQGHAVISGLYVLLARINTNLNTKISVQISILAFVYFGILVGQLADLRGTVSLPFHPFSPLWIVFPIGILGWFSTREKLQQSEDLAAQPTILKTLYFLGLGLIFWLIWKVRFAGNQPAEELLKHVLTYTQAGFTLFFMVYLMSNFLGVMNSGKAVQRILFKPFSLPYYHLRVGGLIAILVIMVYMEAVVAAQFNSLTSNILGDYYYQTEQKLEASILYENSWDTYRKNPKAKFLTAQLLFDLNQPSLAKEHLEQSFSEVPQVDNILLLCERLNRENKPFEVIFYLENGLKKFPDNPYLVNNLALYYTLTQQTEKAEKLLEGNSSDNPVTEANRIALQTKLNKEILNPEEKGDLISQINALAAIRKSGKMPEEDLIKSIRQNLEKETSPLLIHAGWRNLVTQKTTADPIQDLALLDSLTKKEEFLDYFFDLQETACLRSLAADRIMEAVKNLNGLAFRNPGDAAYYLQLTAMIQAQNLDFVKAAKDLIVAEEKGFQAFAPHHLKILKYGRQEALADSISRQFKIAEDLLSAEYESTLPNFNEWLPEKAWEMWRAIADPSLKKDLSIRLLSQKTHGLKRAQIQELGSYFQENAENAESLQAFLANPDWANAEALSSLMKFLNAGEDLAANPYFTPLVLSAADRIPDPLSQYEILQASSEFNRDPLLWMRKVQAAKRLGLDHYAAAAIQEMSGWMTWDEIEKLQMANY
ncbi:tetratricopeptide repeat protein [Algoriphagus taiwanensis]|uniref:Tetratricopeptide repeat protein n=1 Tax=Algoriphagus taiwanensis TaxID=1445656 RepID=A0ABQ6Q4N9_9BACT|nr:hypothetical protein Ataiwa_33160 [Algoriphagus taiwanensis]